MANKVADKTYYLDENRQVTEDQDKASFVLVNEGQEIPADMADQYGIGKVAQPDDEGEKSAKPSANKSATPTKNKGVK